ncbi:MAG TPA: Ig-like domain-containing protein, partial [Armatimonadota bacterium]|nr:Ig-like domain-containing protein [Armatimonadota bacterium]
MRALASSPAAVLLDSLGAEQRLLVSGFPRTGSRKDLTRRAAYRSTNPKVAQVSAEGLIRATGDGSASIEVRAGGK